MSLPQMVIFELSVADITEVAGAAIADVTGVQRSLILASQPFLARLLGQGDIRQGDLANVIHEVQPSPRSPGGDDQMVGEKETLTDNFLVLFHKTKSVLGNALWLLWQNLEKR